MSLDQNTAKWKASVSVSLTPVNRYGDELAGAQRIGYSIELDGSLVEIVKRLERLKESSS